MKHKLFSRINKLNRKIKHFSLDDYTEDDYREEMQGFMEGKDGFIDVAKTLQKNSYANYVKSIESELGYKIFSPSSVKLCLINILNKIIYRILNDGDCPWDVLSEGGQIFANISYIDYETFECGNPKDLITIADRIMNSSDSDYKYSKYDLESAYNNNERLIDSAVQNDDHFIEEVTHGGWEDPLPSMSNSSRLKTLS